MVDYHTVDITPQNAKGMCWACWERTETPSNPLIRACQGCKDVDLMWIHLTCMNKYLNTLPTRKSSFGPAQCEESLFNTSFTRQTSYVTNEYACTRCKSTYLVRVTPSSPLIILWKDPFLLYAMVALVVSMTVLSACCITLIYSFWNTYTPLSDWVPIDLAWFAVVIFAVCHVIHALTWVLVLNHCGKMSTKSVVPLFTPNVPSYNSLFP